MLHCSAAALSPSAFQYCLSGEGGVCGVRVLSVGPCVLLEGEREVCISGRHNLCGPALRISFDDISLSNYRIIFKISYKYRYRIFFENITRY